jgi:putative peptide zinc metalloprotease protein
MADWQAAPMSSRILRQVPAATRQLPSKALGSSGGGQIALDPRDGSGLEALEQIFVLDLQLPLTETTGYLGRRVAVRFDHGSEPLAAQWYRSLRQLFLSHFGV